MNARRHIRPEKLKVPVATAAAVAPAVVATMVAAAVATAVPAAPIYNYIPTTHEIGTAGFPSLAHWGARNAKAGLTAITCKGTPRGECYYTMLDERTTSMYD